MAPDAMSMLDASFAKKDARWEDGGSETTTQALLGMKVCKRSWKRRKGVQEQNFVLEKLETKENVGLDVQKRYIVRAAFRDGRAAAFREKRE